MRRSSAPHRPPLLLQLFEALKSNSSITSVNLSANHIGDEGVQVRLAAS